MTNSADKSTYDKFLEYRAVVIEAIAKAWQDEVFYEELKADPVVALKDGLDYDFPFNMNLAINPENAVWDPETTVDWIVNTENSLELILPPKPEEGEEAVALAKYNSSHLTFLTEEME